MRRVQTAVEKLASGNSPEAEENSQYAIPLAYRKRALFKMDFAEVVYISELRTTPAGHVSYRNVAYAMYEAVAPAESRTANSLRPRAHCARPASLPQFACGAWRHRNGRARQRLRERAASRSRAAW